MEADLDGRVLLLAPTSRDADLARGIFERASLAAKHCRSVAEICAELARGAGAVLMPEEAIVEGPSKRDPSVLTGRTRQNKLVHFASAAPLRVGTFVDVRITQGASHYLHGELVEVTAGPRHRTRIPVAAS